MLLHAAANVELRRNANTHCKKSIKKVQKVVNQRSVNLESYLWSPRFSQKKEQKIGLYY